MFDSDKGLTQEQEDIRQLRGMGCRSIAKQYRKMASALRVIQVWAECERDNNIRFNPAEAIKLCDGALRRFKA